MNVRDLEAFQAVVETGSVVAAAARLGLTQPAVSRRLQGLERLLAVQLLDRTGKPLRPTEAGQRVYQAGHRVLRAVEDLRASFAGAAAPSGELRLGISPFVAEVALGGPLDALRKAYPAVQVRVVSAWSPELLEQVRRAQLDAAAVYLPPEERLPEELAAAEVAERPVAVVAARDAAFGTRVRLARLRGVPWVLNEDGCGFRALLRHACERAGLPLEVAVEAAGTDLQLSLVARGVGLGLVPAGALRAGRWRNRIRSLLVPELPAAVAVTVVQRQPLGPLAAAVARFREALAAAYAAQGRAGGG